ncbi:MAG: hypothetical protein KAS13_08455 [Candidatus Omnitrophica bacterium]|nr:hypothetical protein [Candidatus Omnitrophota bacterium]
MKKVIITFVVMLIFASFIELSYCDIVHLKNGRKIEGKIIEKTDDLIRITVSGGTISFKKNRVKKIEEADFAPPENTTLEQEDISTPKSLSDMDIVNKMAEEDIKRSLSGIIISKVSCRRTSIKGFSKCFISIISYQSRYAPETGGKTIQLVYKFNNQNSRWIRPKKVDILQLAEPQESPTDTRNKSREKQGGRKWKKEYKKGPIRRYRRLIGPDQKKDEEWDN